MTAASFDPRALTEPVDRRAARAFWRGVRPQGQALLAKIVAGVVIAGFALVFVGVGSQVVGTFLSVGASVGGGFGTAVAVVPILFGLLVVAGLVAVLRSVVGSADAIRAYRLDRFARANGMTYDPGTADPPLPGMIFGQGHGRRSASLVRGQRPRFVEIGNYTYRTGSGKEETTHRWGYVAIRLDAPLPNIVLDAAGNNGLFGSNLPERFAAAQRLSLEGDFDRYFRLYCPSGYEQDALYLFTPDIMARFIDHAAALDAEVVDDWLFLYAQRDLSTLDPATWSWLLGTIRAILDKTAQWARWRDDRMVRDAAGVAGRPAAASLPEAGPHPFVATSAALTPPPAGVAPAGRRLRRTTPAWTIAGFAVIAAVWLVLSNVILR